MVYKKYIKRGKKVHGPYVYRSKRINGKVVSEYIGKEEEKTKEDALEVDIKKEIEKTEEIKQEIETRHETKTSWLIIPLMLVLISLSLFFLFKFYFIPTGKISLEIEPSYKVNETISGLFKLNIKHGELIPKDSLVKLSLGSQEKEISLEELITLGESEGSFYVENVQLEGSGVGYGFLGEKKISQELEFELLIYEEIEEIEEEEKEENITISENITKVKKKIPVFS